MSDEMRFDIPQNKKRGQNFWGIEKKGWAYFCPALLLYLCLVLILPVSVPSKMALMLFLSCITGYSLQTDEATGKFNGWYLVRIFRWTLKPKTVHLKWGDKGEKRVKRFERNDLSKEE